MTINKYKL